MDFGFSEEQELLRKTARDFLGKECPMTYVRRMMDDDRGVTDAYWEKLAALGWAGLTYVDLVVVLEEMGRVVMPGPFFSTVVGSVAVLEGGSDAQKQEYLPRVAA